MKVEVAALGSQSLISLVVSVDVQQPLKETNFTLASSGRNPQVPDSTVLGAATGGQADDDAGSDLLGMKNLLLFL